MKKFLLLFISMVLFVETSAQDGYGSTSVYDRVVTLPTGKHFFIIPPNKTWDQQNWKDSVYRFEKFQSGKLEMTNGFIPSHRPMINYNVMFEAIDIKQPTGEIVRMRRSPAIKFVWIGDQKFYNDPAFGYVEILLDGKISVARKTYMDALYELSNGNRYPMSSLMDTKVPSTKATQYFWQMEQYLIVDPDLKVVRASAPVLKRILPKRKKEIKGFIRGNHIDFRKKEDIMKVVAFVNDIASKED
jgi:hypothetical protein